MARDMKQAQASYKPELDGLRAIAILAVVIFHVRPSLLRGGYLGVDIFFVLSGYLILGQLIDDAKSGRLSANWVFSFAAKRALRLFAPLAIVIAATVTAMPLFPVLPAEAEAISASVPWAAFFLANHHFASEAGYFAATSDSKPLLHIWSLAVEEQFYFAVALVVALSILANNQARVLYVAGVLVFVASLAAWIGTPTGHETTKFFLLPWRAWEFIAGGVVAILARRLAFPPLFGVCGALIAIAGIVTSDGDAFTRGALLTTAGTGMVLLAPASLRQVLSVGPMTWVGRVSYGWYLWHWPVLFYARTLNLGQPDLIRDSLAALIALALAWVMYRLVERPLRDLRRSIGLTTPRSRNFGYVCASLAALIIAALSAPLPLSAYHGANAEILAGQAEALSRADSRIKNAEHTIGGVPFRGSVYRTGETSPKILVLGDSYAHSLAGALLDFSSETGVSSVTYWSVLCAPVFDTREYALLPAYAESCWKLRDHLDHSLESMNQISAVVLMANWRLYFQRPGFAHHLGAAIRRLASNERRVLLVAQSVRFPDHLTGCAVRASLSYESFDACRAPRKRVLQNRYVAELRKIISEFENVRLVDLGEGFCDSKWCRPHIAGVTVFMDHNHLNPAGARASYQQFRDSFHWMAGYQQSAVPTRGRVAAD